MNCLTDLIKQVQKSPKQIVVVANAADETILETVKLALKWNLCNFLLLGDQVKIVHIANKINLSLTEHIEIQHKTDRIGENAVQSIIESKATILMKGNISTKRLLQAVLKKERGLRTSQLLSHVALFNIPDRNKPIILTDAAINIAPSLNEKIKIIENAVQVSKLIGTKLPRVAVIAPVDVINEAIPSTIDAGKLSEMQEVGVIQNCLIDGPISLDNAISLKTANYKSITSKTSGIADILIVPSIEVGNALYKSLVFFVHAKVAAVVVGAKAPIALSSRADSPESKLYSLVLAITMI